MNTGKTIIITSLICFFSLAGFCQGTTSYVKTGMKTFLEIGWTADNFGTIQWQRSTDGGNNWTNINGATKPEYEFTTSSGAYYRAKIESQGECEPTYITREIKTVDFTVNLISTSENKAEFEISQIDFKDANIVEYGFSYNLSDLSTRSYRDMQKIKAGNSIPSENTFTINCEGLIPNTSYYIHIYFKTEDGSMIYGPKKAAKTLPGIKWTTEDWEITKTTIAAQFELAGYTGTMGNSNLVFKYGTTQDNLQIINTTDLGNNRYASEKINNLTPNTNYFIQVEANFNGEAQTLIKEVKTLPDYSDVIVDNTTQSVKHTIRWDATRTLHRISPEGLNTEYPRIIRLNKDTLLCAYHGGSGNDQWLNIYLQKSFDNGRTWATPTILMDKEKSTIGNRYWRFVNPEMIKLQNGWILMTFVGNGRPETNENCHVMVITSKDGGETWNDPIIVGRGRTWEPMIVQLPNGELEMLVASEAAWWNTGGDLHQEILFSRSTDNGQTWTAFKRACYSPNRRDGMPVATVLQGNKGILFGIEIVNDNGFGSPSLVHRALNEEWDSTDWDGVSDSRRWKVNMNNAHGGAPYILQLPSGEIVVSAHVNGRNNLWQTSYPRIVVGDNNGKNFTTPTTPLPNLPSNKGAYYNSLFLKDDETVWLVVTHSLFEGTNRKQGEIMYLEGKIIKR